MQNVKFMRSSEMIAELVDPLKSNQLNEEAL